MNEALGVKAPNLSNDWPDLAFKQLTDCELTIGKKKKLLQFFEEKGGEDEYDGYQIFVSDVNDSTESALTSEEIISELSDACSLHCLNGFDPEDEFQSKYLENIDLTTTPIVFPDRSFTQIRLFTDGEARGDRETQGDIFCRFYICPETKSLPKIIEKLVDKYKEYGQNLSAKFTGSNQRNDRMVIYSDKESVPVQLELLQEIKNENPELFENLGKNKLWSEIKGVDGIYFGENNPYSKSFSYSEDRAKVVGKSYEMLKSIIDSGQEINDEIIETIFDSASLERDVDPKHWGKLLKKKAPRLVF